MDSLMKYLPHYYLTSKVMNSLAQVEDEEFALFKEKFEATLDQFFVNTADFTLERWEKELGIPVNNSKPPELRRSVIKSKIRGQGTVTATLIQNVAQSYDNGEIDVIEHNELYSFEIKFIGTLGIPPNLKDLKKAVEEIKPAHLAVIYTFKYITIDRIQTMTLAELQENPMSNFVHFINE